MAGSGGRELYDEVKLIGRGNFGTAHLCKHRESGALYVIKMIKLYEISETEKEASKMEVKLLSSLKHPGIVEYADSFIQDGILHIVMAYCEGGDMSNMIKSRAAKGEPFTEEQILDWFIQLLSAIRYIHDRKILHRDLKTSNIFLTKNNIIKLGDFGIARILEGTFEAAMTVVGTPFYMSPEVCENKPYSYKSDLWALGCILYEMCTLKHAFDATNLLGLVFKIVQEKHPPIPAHYSKEMSNLVSSLLSKDPDERMSPSAILKLPFIRERLMGMTRSGGTVGKLISRKKTHKEYRAAKRAERVASRERELKEAARMSALEREEARARGKQQFRPTADAHTTHVTTGDMAELAMTRKISSESKDALKARPKTVPVGSSPYDDDGSLPEPRREAKTWSNPADERPITSKGRYAFEKAPTAWDEDVYGEEDAGRGGDGREDREAREARAKARAEARRKAEAEGSGGGGKDDEDSDDGYSDDFEEESDEEYAEASKARDKEDQRRLMELLQEHVDEPARAPTPSPSTPSTPVAATAGVIKPVSQRTAQIRKDLVSKLGPDRFEKVYTFMRDLHDAGAAPNPREVRAELNRICGGDKKLLDSAFLVDQLIWSETTFGK